MDVAASSFSERKVRRGTIARTSISVPAAMLTEMRKHPDVNWSGVAANAFVRKLEELNSAARNRS